MTTVTHLSAFHTRLSHEKARLAAAEKEGERQLRKVWISQIEREIESEMRFLNASEPADVEMTDDELLAALDA